MTAIARREHVNTTKAHSPRAAALLEGPTHERRARALGRATSLRVRGPLTTPPFDRRSLLIVAVTVLGCGNGDSGSFSEAELRSIRNELGALPAAPPPDPSNAVADRPDAAALGKKFFFDDGYSDIANANAVKVSCATCHAPDSGYQDARDNTSLGLDYTGRHAPSIINAAFGSGAADETVWHFWDGRKDSQWSQALGPPESGVEMGSTRTRIAIHVLENYRAEYEAVFGTLPAEITTSLPEDAMPGTPSWDVLSPAEQRAINRVYSNFGKAIAAYERKVVSRDSRFDRFWAEIARGASDSAALTDEEKLGLRVFIGKGDCLACHAGPNFSDWKFHNIGVPQVGGYVPSEDRGRAGGIAGVRADPFNCAGDFSDRPDKTSCGIAGLTNAAEDLGAFRTMTLRDVSKTAPYMHTGALATLEEVVEHYNIGGASSGFLGESVLQPLALTDHEKAALVAFMRSLDGAPLDASITGAL